MIALATWWCRLFGYLDCHALSTVEAVIIGGLALAAGYFVLMLTVFIFMTMVGAIR